MIFRIIGESQLEFFKIKNWNHRFHRFSQMAADPTGMGPLPTKPMHAKLAPRKARGFRFLSVWICGICGSKA